MSLIRQSNQQMILSQNKITSQKNSLSNDLKTFENHFPVQSKVGLSFMGIVFLLSISFLSSIFGFYLCYKHFSQVGLKNFSNELNQLRLSINEIDRGNDDRFKESDVIAMNRDLLLSARKEFKSVLKNSENNLKSIIKKRDDEIWQLREQLKQSQHFIDAQKKITQQRQPMNKVIPYSASNLHIYRFQQEQKLSQLREKHRLEKEAFLSLNNMYEDKAKKDFQRLIEAQDLEVYSMKQKQTEKRADFQRNKFRMVKGGYF